MKPRISVITLAVDDLSRAVRFYRDGLGLRTEGIVGEQFEHGAVAFFDLQAGLKLALWPRGSLAHDSGLAPGPASATEFSLGHNVASREEVDAVMAQATDAGARLVKAAADTFWGATPATSRTRTDTSGKSSGTRHCCRTRRAAPDARRARRSGGGVHPFRPRIAAVGLAGLENRPGHLVADQTGQLAAASSSRSRSTPVSRPMRWNMCTRSSVQMLPLAPGA